MPDSIESRVGKLEIDFARVQEQYNQIMKTLSEISGQLTAFNSTFIRKDLCEQAHKAYDREQYEFRHNIEKRIIEQNAILAGEIQKIEHRLKNDIDGIGQKLTGWTNRVWWLFGLAFGPAMAIIVKEIFSK
jgi:hypothetical protein